MRYSKRVLVAVCGVLGMQIALAAPTPEEAAQLGKTLTPVGAIKAGNREGTIPEWTGGVCTPPANYKPKFGVEAGGAPYADPYAGDKPLFKITAENLAKYADKVDAGTADLFRRYPKTFYMNVYPTHRSACFPSWVYENTVKNVMRPKIVGGNVPSVAGAHAQIPFPIPKSGVEAVWNMMLRFDRPLATSQYLLLYVDASGRRTMIDSDVQTSSRPYWDNSLSLEKFEAGGMPHTMLTASKVYPPSAVGVGMLQYRQSRPDLRGDPVWSYIPGQRRVRLAPEFAYDGVAPSAGGLFLYDEGSGFSGKMDKFDFNLLGRKEYYISYNSNSEKLNKEETATPNHMNPEAIRWELHRVWVVEATLKPGERHVQKKKVIYIDEDSWHPAVYYGVDHADKVHHLFYFHIAPLYDIPSVGMHAFDSYDLTRGAYATWMQTSGSVNGITTYGGRAVKAVAPNVFTPEGLVGSGVR